MKNIIFLGSSVTDGDDGYSMCEYISETTRHTVIKLAVRGTTLSDISEESYVSRLNNAITKHPQCDCFVCQLSTNDASKALPLGNISDSYDIKSFDVCSVIGAIEYIVCKVKEVWNCPVIFYTGTYYDNENYQKMVDSLILLRKKWDFDIIDLWNSEKMRAVNKTDYSIYMKDHVHPSKTGYQKWWGPEFLNTIRKYIND